MTLFGRFFWCQSQCRLRFYSASVTSGNSSASAEACPICNAVYTEPQSPSARQAACNTFSVRNGFQPLRIVSPLFIEGMRDVVAQARRQEEEKGIDSTLLVDGLSDDSSEEGG